MWLTGCECPASGGRFVHVDQAFTDGPQASSFVAVLDSDSTLVEPVISLLEVFKLVLRKHSEAQAIQAVAAMKRGLVVDLDSTLANAAAQLSHAHRLTMAGCTEPMLNPAALATTLN